MEGTDGGLHNNRQKTMEDTDGGLHPAVDGQSLGERRKTFFPVIFETKYKDL